MSDGPDPIKIVGLTLTVEVDGLEVECRRCARTGRKRPIVIQSAWAAGRHDEGKDPDRLIVSQWQDPEGWQTIHLQGDPRVEVCPGCALIVRRAIAAALGPGKNVP